MVANRKLAGSMKLTALLLAMLMMLSVLSACGKKDNNDGTSSNDGASKATVTDDEGNVISNDDSIGDTSDISDTGSEATVTDASGNVISDDISETDSEGVIVSRTPINTNSDTTGVKVVNNCYTTGTKIAKSKVTFKVLIRDHFQGRTVYDDSAFAKYVESTFNIKLTFDVVPPTEAVGEKVTLAYASGELPDMFWGTATSLSGTHAPYIKDGTVVQIGKYLDTYGPNIKNMFEETPETEYWSTFEDGKVYTLPMYAYNDNRSWKLFINKTWLGNLSIKLPTTTTAFKEVLKSFKNQDANKNGSISDEIPFIICGDIPYSLYAPFGLNAYTNVWTLDQSTGKVVYGAGTEEYRTGLKYYKGLYDEKLLYSNFRGTSYTQVKEWTSGNVQTVGVFTANSWNEACSAEAYYKNYTLLPPLTGPNPSTSTYCKVEFENLWDSWAVLLDVCEYKEVAVRLLDWLYSKEGTITSTYGPRGNYWDYNSKGLVEFNTDKIPKGKTASEYILSLTPQYPIPHYTPQSSEDWYADVKADTSTYEGKATAAYEASYAAMYKKVLPKYIYPHLSLTYSESKALTEKNGDYFSYAFNMRWNFIGGTASLDNDWDSYVAQLKKLGISNSAAAYQTAYNRYKVWLKNNK